MIFTMGHAVFKVVASSKVVKHKNKKVCYNNQ